MVSTLPGRLTKVFKNKASRTKQAGIFPVKMTGPDSFLLHGQEYSGKPSITGRLSEGERTFAAFRGLGRRLPVIIARATRTLSQRNRPFTGIISDVLTWLQSNQSSKQIPLGGKLPGYCYEPDTGNYHHRWALPTRWDTDDDPENVETGFLAYGFGRWQPQAGDDLFVAAYPQKSPTGGYAICIGAWGVSSLNPAWEANFGYGDGSPTQYDFRAQQFFLDQLSGWATVLPDLNLVPSRACSAKSGSIQEQSELDKLPWHASLHSFQGPDLTVQSYLCLPKTDNSDTTVDFWQMNQSTGAWTKVSSYAAADLPEGGASVVPDILPNGTDQLGPVSVVDNQFLIPVSGGRQDIFAPDNWLEAYLGVRGIKPDGTAGSRLASVTIAATDSPRILANASFTTQALAASYPLRYEFSGDSFLDNPLVYRVYGGVELGASTASFYEKIPKCPPVFMPPAGPNMQHLPKSQGLELRMAYTVDKNWPSDTVTRLGRMPVDDEGTAWFCALVPEQVLYYSDRSGNIPGGEVFSIVDSGETQTVYFWTSVDDQTECSLGTNRGFGWNVDSTHHPMYGGNVGTDPDSWPTIQSPCGNTAGTRYRSYSMEDKGSRPHWKYRFNLGLGILWNTKLYGLKSDSSLIELDISQKHDVNLSADFGIPVKSTYSTTETGVPTPDAVWDWIPVTNGEQRLMAILRDLHYERDGDCQPAPVIEIRDLSDGAVLSVVRLGSQERRDSDFTSGDWSYKEGDNTWNPYAHGAPRMKACRDLAGNPVIVAMVGEQKVVDVLSEPQFNRAWYYSLNLADPENPDVVERRQTSDEVAVGEAPGDPAFGAPGDYASEFNYPLWRDWDTLVLTGGHLAWIRNSNFFELVP